jgi:CubicO group peptidase (beta-lactamase class C family)
MRLKLSMPKNIFITATLILSSISFVSVPLNRAQTARRADARNAVAPQKYPATVALFDSFIRREMADKQLPGIAIALIDGAQIVWQKSYGFFDLRTKTPLAADTVFRVGSVSKLFTDIAVMQLVEQGKLDLDSPATKYLPDFKPRNSFNSPITLRRLISHRAELVREPPVGN